MKRFLKISFCIIMAVLMCIPMMACNNGDNSSSKSGIDVRKANGAYIVKSYAKEVVNGEVIDTLVISGKTVVGNDYNGEEIKIAANAFEGNNTLKEIVITDVTEIGKGAFAGMTKLKTLVLPFAGSKIGAVDNARLMGYLFGESSYDEGIAITQTVSGSEATSDATTATYYVPASLTTITISAKEEGYVLPEKTFSGFDSALKTVILNENVSEIADGAFMKSSITEIDIPNSVTKIGAYAFASCPMLKTVTFKTIPETNKYNLVSIGEKAFYQFKGNKIEFHVNKVLDKETQELKNVLVIGTLAFAESKLTTIVGYENVLEAGKWAFYKSEGLEKPTVNADADKFGNAFDSCK